MLAFKSKKHQIGAATSIDMCLTFPLFVVLITFMVQMALVLHAYTVVHYAAYKGARAARVHVLDGDHAFLQLDLPYIVDIVASIGNGAIILDSMLGDGSVTDLLDDELRQRVRASAMNQLVSISPGSTAYAVNANGEAWHEPSVRQYLTAATEQYSDGRLEPLMRKANYAYSDLNTQVEFKFLDFKNPLLQEAEDVWRIYDTITSTPLHSQVDIPVTVTVKYRYELQIPIGQLFFANDPTRNYGRVMEATVKLM